MFDNSQLEKLLSVLTQAHEQNEFELSKLKEDTNIKKTAKNVLLGKMEGFESASSVAISALNQVKKLLKEKEELELENKNIKADLYELCDSNNELEVFLFLTKDEMMKLREHIELQNEETKAVSKTHDVLEREKLQLLKELESRSKKNKENSPEKPRVSASNKENLRELETEEGVTWKSKYNQNVESIKLELEELRKSTHELRAKISENQNRIKQTLKTKKSKEELISIYDSSKSINSPFKKKETAKNSILEFGHNEEGEKETEVSCESSHKSEESHRDHHKIARFSSLDQRLLNSLVNKLLPASDNNESNKNLHKDSYIKKIIEGLVNSENYLFERIVKNRIRSGFGSKRVDIINHEQDKKKFNHHEVASEEVNEHDSQKNKQNLNKIFLHG